MDFFNKLTKKATETYKTAAEKTGKLANETKLKIKISDYKSKISEVYTEIGKKVYQKYQLNGDFDIKSHIKEELERIDELNSQIRDCEAEILKLSDMRQCVKCKNTIDKTAKFCPACGAEQPEEVKEVEVADVVETEQKNEQNQENNQPKTTVEEAAVETDKVVEEVVLEENENNEN